MIDAASSRYLIIISLGDGRKWSKAGALKGTISILIYACDANLELKGKQRIKEI